MKYYINFYYTNFICIFYNISSIFFILTNIFIPMYSEEILYFNRYIIKQIYINYNIESTYIRNDFLNFMNSIIKKNNDFIDYHNNYKKKELDINNFTNDNIYSESDSDSDYDYNSDYDSNLNNSSTDIIPSLINLSSSNSLAKSTSDNFIFEN